MFGKKQNLDYTHFVYTVYDSVSKKCRGCFYHSTDEEMIRTTLPTILMDYPLRDIEIRRVGMFNEDTGELFSARHVIIPTDCYTFPHSRLSCDGDNLDMDELDSAMKEKKNEIIANLSKMKDDNKESEVVNE